MKMPLILSRSRCWQPYRKLSEVFPITLLNKESYPLVERYELDGMPSRIRLDLPLHMLNDYIHCVPFTVRANIILQRTWASGLDLDTPLPADIASESSKWELDIVALKLFAVPRYIDSLSSKILTRELGLFCDVSVFVRFDNCDTVDPRRAMKLSTICCKPSCKSDIRK